MRDKGSIPPGSPSGVSRRSFARWVTLTAAAGCGATTASPAFATTDPILVAAQRSTLLDVARAVATLPVPFPSFGESGPATSRVSPSGTHDVLSRLRPERLAQLRAGLNRMAAAGLEAGAPPQIVNGLGSILAGGGAAAHDELRAVVAVAVAILSRHFDPDADGASELWLGFVRNYHTRMRPVSGK
jgi:hypothetical protein